MKPSLTPATPQSKNRVNYIDALKGIAMFLVIWCHTDTLKIDPLTLAWIGNYTFFFLSGIFFRPIGTKEFFKTRLKYILTPFLIYYLLSIPYNFFYDWCKYGSIKGFDWQRILDIFLLEDNSSYLSLNIALWFLLALFIIQMAASYIYRLPKWVVAISALIPFMIGDRLLEIPSLFMINNACYWYWIFTMGYLIGKPLLGYLKSTRKAVYVASSSLCLLALILIWISMQAPDWYEEYTMRILYLTLVIFLVAGMSFLDKSRAIQRLNYFGANSLTALGCHLFFLLPISRICFAISGIHHPMLGFLYSVVTCVILYPLMGIINKRFPFLAGRNYKRS